MFCIQCGEDNPDQASFCRRCGTQLEKQAGFPSPDSSHVPQIPLSSTEQMPFPNFPTLQAQSEMTDGPTLRAQPNIPNPELPPGEAQSWGVLGSNQPFEQFSFIEPPTQSNIPGTPPFQAQPGTSDSGYLSGGLQSPGLAAPYASPYQQGFANQGSGSSPDMQMQMPASNMYFQAADTASMAPPPPVAREPQVRTIARPLPAWIFILNIVVAVAIFAALFFTCSDWAAVAIRIAA